MLHLSHLLLNSIWTLVSSLAAGAMLQAAPQPTPQPPPVTARPAPFVDLGVKDTGVFGQFQNKVGFSLPRLAVGGTRIHVNKKTRTLVLYDGAVPRKVYPVALGFAPVGHKRKQGDGRTPEGSYTICEALHANLAPSYGARSLRLSYPGLSDAQAALASGLIDKTVFARIRDAHARNTMPPQTSPLGGSIRIHGGGAATDWTLGCIALRDADVIELYERVKIGTPVVVSADKTPDDRDGDGIPDLLDTLIGAIKLVHNAAKYDGRYFAVKYPGGDVPAAYGVCTDVVIRAMRNAGIDLQKDILGHIRSNRGLYPWITKPDTNIDHRRVRNMIVYFTATYKLLDRGFTAASRATYLPGDVVFMDTLPKAGPDHVGVVSEEIDIAGNPTVINNWTTGYVTQRMSLLPTIPVTHHFRLIPK
ncbi:DUF1287 domain-containing protein [Myxococcota bacterium]|nr:DUF1287 domain-containing protein [Myxococcota bacterium]MBU1413815.1 DUF1287 domain-containing protein [Myxococcota bacterium]MBU1510740.1 DUF1287 domain-containing protein [Myxococcota bacterium]